MPSWGLPLSPFKRDAGMVGKVWLGLLGWSGLEGQRAWKGSGELGQLGVVKWQLGVYLITGRAMRRAIRKMMWSNFFWQPRQLT